MRKEGEWMRANIGIKFDKQMILPIQYNHILQAVILNWLGDENYQKFIHDEGYKFENRRYKMYTFSKLFGRYSIDKINKTITFIDTANFTISSVENKFLNYLINNIITHENIMIGKNAVEVEKVQAIYKKMSQREKIYTKSPITVYSTFKTATSRKTYYYSPMEREFSELIRNNLIKKYIAVFSKEPSDTSFIITPIKNGRLRENLVMYKGFVVKGWSGEFIMEGSQELLTIAYDSGLGSKNSQGFGCIEIADTY